MTELPPRSIERARSAIGKGTKYVLGKGGRPKDWGIGSECDCTGFVAWWLGLDRYLPKNFPGYPGGEWLETTAVYRDAMSNWGFVDAIQWDQAVPGDIVVWGDRGGHQGHIGIVATVDATGPKTVIHCSSGNYKTTKDAIRETGAALFLRNGAVVAQVRP